MTLPGAGLRLVSCWVVQLLLRAVVCKFPQWPVLRTDPVWCHVVTSEDDRMAVPACACVWVCRHHDIITLHVGLQGQHLMFELHSRPVILLLYLYHCKFVVHKGNPHPAKWEPAWTGPEDFPSLFPSLTSSPPLICKSSSSLYRAIFYFAPSLCSGLLM